ncbi:translation initiation factor 2 subunit beta [Hokovirus HKV1]|uniref:Translation initiation factor 2 subunit beta n=1 Tax=Hokovirus HKV1 TaxID=1977638 RepID=A0A1V0SEV3_9VIRU|nr:translation initiation factor 2 subunit beta [Hokovirus HKV1]
MSVNIPNNDDPFYRYKREKIILKSESYRTVLVNLNNISNAIERNSETLATFIKYKLNINIVEKQNVWYTSSKITVDDIENAIEEFINYFVLCPTCKIPETNLITKKKDIELSCRACSKTNTTKNDKKHVIKFSDYILKKQCQFIKNY